MKQITITLPDADAGKFVAQLLDLNVTFTVTTTVAKDPMVFAASEAMGPPKDPDPVRVEAGLLGATVGQPRYYTRGGRKVQRLTPDGRTAMQVVEAKLHQIAGRRFSLFEIKDLAQYSGFQPDTLQNQLHTLMGRGRLVKFGKNTYQEVPTKQSQGKRASPLPGGLQEELPLTPPSEPAPSSGNERGEFVNNEGWREPVQ